MKTIDRLVAAAEAAIDRVFSETSIPQEETIAHLKDLISNCEIKVEAIKDDLKRASKCPR